MADQDLSPAPHALLVSFPIAGHVNPTIHFAFRLLGLGFSVTLAVSDAFASSLSKLVSGIDLLIYSDPKIGEHNIMEFIFSDQSCIRDAVESFAYELRLSGKLKSFCIICDHASQSWVPDLATDLRVPYGTLYTFSAAGAVVSDNLPMLISDIAAADAKEQVNGIVSQLPGLLPLGPFDIPRFVRPIMANAEECFKKAPGAPSTWKFVNSFQELEQDAFQSSNLLAVGPLLQVGDGASMLNLNSGNLKEDFSCLEWLDKHPPSSVLYVSFGSMATMSVLQVDILIQALKASNQTFLWALRPDFLSDAPDFYVQNLKQSIGDQGMITSWAPQLKILGHEAVGGFLTHGGWNSVLESICMGVPMIGWPCYAEQHMNCKYIADGWKIGVRISKDGLIEEKEICDLISKLMKEEEGKETRRRAMEFRDMARRSSMVDGSSFKNLVAFKQALLAQPDSFANVQFVKQKQGVLLLA